MCAEDLFGFGTFGVLDFLKVQEADLRSEVQEPITVVLYQVSVPYIILTRSIHTSLLVTGLSTNDKNVNFLNPLSTSRSASSATLFRVRTRVLNAGTFLTTFASILFIRFLAHNKVCSLGLCGKLVRTVMSLSVKSMHSWSRAAPRFSMVGILWPVVKREIMYQLALLYDASVAICPFQEIVWV